MDIITLVTILSTVVLIGIALYYQINKKKLKSDPVLISACYLWAAFNIGLTVTALNS